MLYISTTFCDIISNGIKVIEWTQFLYWKIYILYLYLERYQSYRADTISIRKITKGNNSAKNVGGATVLISACRLVMLYVYAKFHEIISNGIKVIEWTQFL